MNLLFAPLWIYEGGIFFNILVNLVIVVVTYWSVLRREHLLVDADQLVLWRKFPYQRRLYQLKDLTDFGWSGSPFGFSTRYGRGAQSSNHQFELTFRSGESLLFQEDDYGNFAEIRNYFYNYCVDQDIIQVRSLPERKRSRLRSRRRLT